NHPQLRAKTLFATHYHELTALASVLPRLENLHVEIAEEGSDLVFLYKISPGSAEKSYGVYAAKLAGLPRPVVRRAQELLGEYEAQGGGRSLPAAEGAKQPAHIHPRDREAKVLQALMQLDPDALAPVEALMKLFELRRLAEEALDESGKVRAIRTA
ncbi:MAG TPA: hypothetical protein VGB05_00625, partial [Pyrinomonadaceae bacterium]